MFVCLALSGFLVERTNPNELNQPDNKTNEINETDYTRKQFAPISPIFTRIQMNIAIIGGGPAGLMAAEAASATGAQVDLYDAMASVGRKFLLAGKGGLNLTHSEPSEKFLSRYGVRRAQIAPLLTSFGPDALRTWARGLGIETFVGTSGRVFPTDLKAAPLLRAWLRRLRQAGVRFHMRHRWSGWDEQGACLLPRAEGSALSRPMRWCLRSAAAVGQSSVLMLHGCRSWQDAGFTLCRYSRRTVASTWAGASIFGRSLPGTRSSRWRLLCGIMPVQNPGTRGNS